jgi:hypothetical protein
MPESRVKVSRSNSGERWVSIDEGLPGDMQDHALLARMQRLDEICKRFLTDSQHAAVSTPLPTVPAFTLPAVPKPAPTPVHTPVSTEIPTEQGSLAAYTLEKLSADLDSLQWTQQQSKKGYWIFWDKVPDRTRQKLAGLFATEASPKGYVKVDGYNYARSGDENMFLNRYPIRPAAMETKVA